MKDVVDIKPEVTQLNGIMMQKILMVHASDFSNDVNDWCDEYEVSTHYQNDVIYVHNDDDVFATWLRINGYTFENKEGDYIAIIAT